MAQSPARDRQASITRQVALGAGVIIALVAVSLSYLSYSKALVDLAYIAEQSALSLNRLFANLLWPGYAGFAATAGTMSPAEILSHERTRAMHANVSELTRGTRILKVKLFDRTGLAVFSSEMAQIGTSSYSTPACRQHSSGASTAGSNIARSSRRSTARFSTAGSSRATCRSRTGRMPRTSRRSWRSIPTCPTGGAR